MKKSFVLVSFLLLLASCGKSKTSSDIKTDSVTPPQTETVITTENKTEPTTTAPITTEAPVSDQFSSESSSTDIIIKEHDLELHFLEMNECYGDSLIIKKENFEILVDGGAQADATHVRKGLKRFVTDRVLDMVIVSHPHADHTGGLSDRNTFREIDSVGTFIDYGYQYATPMNKGYESNRDKYISKGATYYPAYDIFHMNVHSPIFDLGDDVTLEVLDTGLYLPTDTIMNSGYNHNDSSVACVLTYGENKFFFAGDLEAKGEKNLISKYPNYFTDYHVSMKASHHGSESSSCKEFLEYIKPENIFISAAVIEENMSSSGVKVQQHPYVSTLKKYSQYTSSIYWNGTMGTINACFDKENIVSVHGDGATRNYYYNGVKMTSEEEKDMPFPETKWYSTYVK